ncbi:signal recognition particle 19 kDa protein [Exaiptasia diaphana]|uniref:Signal recognition particle 19 kDa protein n=1 Tax=Exaiptasia diaphana TaxID=2652724 RepID=A0A913X9V8_EXADI|nr:signal recognition particle 19 kDa protein [Exaiptasia diaphana]KXJ13823.1 Signal recognition particle 19 kDa protein [Exaiptasia diaphana]
MAATYLSSDPSSKDRWIVIYPAYLNARRTVAQGRRVPKSKSVDNPTVYEIRDVCQSQGLEVGLEDKLYPKDSSKDALCKGRVRVQLKKSDGSPSNDKFINRKSLMLFLGEMIPKLKSRQTKSGQTDSSASQQSAAAKKKKGKKTKAK